MSLCMVVPNFGTSNLEAVSVLKLVTHKTCYVCLLCLHCGDHGTLTTVITLH